jgi:hypothetical protein
MALRFTKMPGVFRPMNGLVVRAWTAIREVIILAITLIAVCNVPSITNVTPERVATGEASATAGTQFVPFRPGFILLRCASRAMNAFYMWQVPADGMSRRSRFPIAAR